MISSRKPTRILHEFIMEFKLFLASEENFSNLLKLAFSCFQGKHFQAFREIFSKLLEEPSRRQHSHASGGIFFKLIEEASQCFEKKVRAFSGGFCKLLVFFPSFLRSFPQFLQTFPFFSIFLEENFPSFLKKLSQNSGKNVSKLG